MLLPLVGVLGCTRQEEIKQEPVGKPDAAPDAPVPTILSCPAGVKGAPLVLLPAKDGSKYCMDARETTRAEYDAFVAAAKKGETGSQPKECAWNSELTPLLWDPSQDDTPPEGYWCEPEHWNGVSPDAPVGCVDFCDALAYCEWAGKRLCGRIGGSKWGRVYDTGFAAPQDWSKFVGTVVPSLESEFINACTQGGATKYPYGNQYQPGICIDDAWVDAGKTSIVTDFESRPCHGTVPPFTGMYDVSGSVGEWQNFCWMPEPSCVMLGTASGAYSVTEACSETVGTVSMKAVARGRGIRCCADAAASP